MFDRPLIRLLRDHGGSGAGLRWSLVEVICAYRARRDERGRGHPHGGLGSDNAAHSAESATHRQSRAAGGRGGATHRAGDAANRSRSPHGAGRAGARCAGASPSGAAGTPGGPRRPARRPGGSSAGPGELGREELPDDREDAERGKPGERPGGGPQLSAEPPARGAILDVAPSRAGQLAEPLRGFGKLQPDVVTQENPRLARLRERHARANQQ